MRAIRELLVPVVALLAVAVVVGLTGCGGGNNAAPAATGGAVTGRCIDARTGLGLGGVLVQVMVGATAVAHGTSTTPNGDFTVASVPPGNYAVLRVTPDPTVFGAPRNIALSPAIAVVDGVATPLPGVILVLDDVPPDPV